MRLFLLFCFSILISIHCVRAQDPNFSQTYMQSMFLNPALTGELKGWLINGHFRSQSYGFAGNSIASVVGIQKQISKYSTGLGLTLLNESFGPETFGHAGLNMSKILGKKDTFQIALGLKIDFGQSNNSLPQSLIFGDQIDNQYGFINPTNELALIPSKVNYLNTTTGIDFKIFKGNLGFSFANINKPKTGYNNYNTEIYLPRRLTNYFSYSFILNESVQFHPIVVYTFQNDINSILYGVSSQYKFINTFIGYRDYDTFISGIGINLNRLKFQYSFDLKQSTQETQSILLPQQSANMTETLASHELGIIFRFGSKNGFEDRNFAF